MRGGVRDALGQDASKGGCEDVKRKCATAWRAVLCDQQTLAAHPRLCEDVKPRLAGGASELDGLVLVRL